MVEATTTVPHFRVQTEVVMDAAIDLVRPGATTDQIAKVWPRAEEFGFADEMDAFGLQFGHGVGVGLHERPIISRLNSLETPEEIHVLEAGAVGLCRNCRRSPARRLAIR